MERMFAGTPITSIDFTDFDTSEVTNMQGIFKNCKYLTSINFNNFNTTKVKDMQYVFSFCNSLTSLELNNFNTSEVTNMQYMFDNCISLKSLDLHNFETFKVNNMKYMFNECNVLASININSFNTSEVIEMQYMFNDCFLLKELNLKNFETSKVLNMSFMFNNCFSLSSLYLNTFETLNTINMERMFGYCVKLKYLNLSNFNTSEVSNMKGMFEGCSSLISLNLSNFNISKIETISNIFAGCQDLEYINIYNFHLTENINSNEMFNSVRDNIVYCINDIDKNSKYFEILWSQNCSVNYCLEDWNNNKKKYIEGKNICLDECYELSKYQYNNICYERCPEGTQLLPNSKNLCVEEPVLCDKRRPYLKLEENKCVKKCNLTEFFSNICINQIPTIEEQIKNINNIISEIQNNTNDLFLLNNKRDAIVREQNLLYQITSSFNQKKNIYNNNNISNIFLGECENLLKEFYKINKTEDLLIFKYDFYLAEYLIPFIGFEVFHPITKEKLDISKCCKLPVNFYIPVNIDKEKLYIHNKSDNYYIDICKSVSSKNETDICLYDRMYL